MGRNTAGRMQRDTMLYVRRLREPSVTSNILPSPLPSSAIVFDTSPTSHVKIVTYSI